MSRTAQINLPWADGDYAFRLGIGELEELDDKLKIGPLPLYKKLVDGTWRAPEVRETLRVGLIGAGMKPVEAGRLVKRYVDDVPDWFENARVASAIVGAIFSGWEDEPLGKRKGAKTSRKATSASSSAPSMPTQQ
jgi:hypothetical protein